MRKDFLIIHQSAPNQSKTYGLYLRERIFTFKKENTQFNDENKKNIQKLTVRNDEEVKTIKNILKMQQQVKFKKLMFFIEESKFM